MDSAQSLNTKATTIKRIYKDLAEIEKDPIDGVSICMPNPENPFKLAANVLILNEPYTGMIIPLTIYIPETYPFNPPEVRIVPGVKFSRDFHGHIFEDSIKGNTICVDILSNYQSHFQGIDYGTIGSLKRVSGWTPGYSLTSILVQMQVFFCEHDLGTCVPNSDRIKKFKVELDKFSYQMDGPCGTKITHSTEKPYPPIAISRYTRESAKEVGSTAQKFKSLETDKSEAKFEKANPPDEKKAEQEDTKAKSAEIANPEFAKRVMCTLMRVNYLENPDLCYGVPIHVNLDKFKRAFTSPVTEIISEDAYRTQLQKVPLNPVLSRQLVSGWGQPYNIWLPIFINKEHLKRSRSSLLESLKIMTYGNDHSNYKFDSTKAVNAICTILNKLVVNLLKGTLIQSVASIEIYCQILLLLVKLQNVFPEITTYLEKRVTDMLKNEQSRSKQNLGDIGEFLVILALSKYGLKDPNVNDVLLQEYSARQVMWVLKEFPDAVYRTNGRTKNFFKGSLVSHQLFVFNTEAAKTFINPEMLEKLEKNYGFPDDDTMNRFLQRIDWVKENVTSYKVFFECIDMNDRINAASEKDMHEYLDRACKISVNQGYTQKPK